MRFGLTTREKTRRVRLGSDRRRLRRFVGEESPNTPCSAKNIVARAVNGGQEISSNIRWKNLGKVPQRQYYPRHSSGRKVKSDIRFVCRFVDLHGSQISPSGVSRSGGKPSLVQEHVLRHNRGMVARQRSSAMTIPDRLSSPWSNSGKQNSAYRDPKTTWP